MKVKKPGALGKNLLMFWWRQEELKAVNENKVSIYLRFLPFWQSGQNVSWCNKLVMITLFGIFALNMVVRSVACQPVDQIFLRTAHLYSIGAKKINFIRQIKIFKESVFHQLVNLFALRFLCLILRLQDCHESHSKTVILERCDHVSKFFKVCIL